MRTAALVLCSLALVSPATALSSVPVTASAEVMRQHDGPAGTWSGAIQVPGQALKISITLVREGDAYSGKIAIPAQGVTGMSLDQITVEGDRIRMRIAGVPGEPVFDGKLDGTRIAGTFTQGGMGFPFELQRGDLELPRRPQDPQPPFPYTVEQVRATHREIVLAGTLTRPPGEGPFPAAILISGSGPQNRDEEIFNHRPFAVLADHLSRAGILVVRYDDRGVAESTGTFDGSTSHDFADDAEAWISVLRARGDVSKVGLIGHSEGGLIAAIVAARNPEVDFVVMLAGTGVDGAATLVEQNRAIMLAGGAPRETADVVAARAEATFVALREGADDETLGRKIRELAIAQGGMAEGPALDRQVEAQLRTVRSPWFMNFLNHDPCRDLRRIRVPVLAINGARDVQVLASQHLPAIEAALHEGGNTRVRTEILPGLNHLFQECDSGSVANYALIEETMNAAALNLVRDWILEHFPAGQP
jgi:uncharacterized protein